MKSRTTKDPRVMNTNGTLSKPRMLVVEALEAQGKEGATIDELVELLTQDLNVDNPKMSIGQSLSKMENDQYIIRSRNRWYLKEHAPSAQPALPPQANGRVQPIAPIAQKRSGKTVELYTSPRVFSDVIGLSLLIKEQWFKLPLFGGVRICMGHESPIWSPEQETFSDVSVIKILLKDGRVVEERPALKDLVTIAPE